MMDSIIKEVEYIGGQLLNIGLKLLKNIKLIVFLAIVVHLVSILLLFFLPFLGSHTYVSEKNLQCTVTPFINRNFSNVALDYSIEFQNSFPKRSIGSAEGLEAAKWIKQSLESIGLESQLHFFNSSFNKVGVNVIGINQAINSLGTESFVFTTSFDQWHSAGSVGFLLGFSKFIKQTRWQARDIIYVFSTEGGEDNGGTSMDISGISVWLHDYHSSNNINIQNLNYMTTIKQKGWTENNQRIMRAGQIYGAIGFDRIGRNSNNNINNNNNNNNNTDSNQQQKVVVYPEGLEGSLSNLDIINVITTTSFLNDIPAGINTHLQNEPVEGSLYGLLVFMWNSALSMPRSNHAIFTRYGINSVGISTDSSHNVWDFDFLNTPFHHKFKNRLDNNNSLSSFNNQTFYNLGKIMETVIHHLHNADEQLHQSYRWYMMAGAVFFIDLGQALLPVIVFNVGIFILLISLGLSTNDIAIKILLSLPWFIATLIYCLLQLCLPKLLSSNFISILPNRDLNVIIVL